MPTAPPTLPLYAPSSLRWQRVPYQAHLPPSPDCISPATFLSSFCRMFCCTTTLNSINAPGHNSGPLLCDCLLLALFLPLGRWISTASLGPHNRTIFQDDISQLPGQFTRQVLSLLCFERYCLRYLYLIWDTRCVSSYSACLHSNRRQQRMATRECQAIRSLPGTFICSESPERSVCRSVLSYMKT